MKILKLMTKKKRHRTKHANRGGDDDSTSSDVAGLSMQLDKQCSIKLGACHDPTINSENRKRGFDPYGFFKIIFSISGDCNVPSRSTSGASADYVIVRGGPISTTHIIFIQFIICSICFFRSHFGSSFGAQHIASSFRPPPHILFRRHRQDGS